MAVAARTFGTLTLAHDQWVIGDLEPHVTIRFKQLFPRIRKWDAPPFVLPNDLAHAADLTWFVQRYPLRMQNSDLVALAKGRFQFDVEASAMERILAPDYKPPARAGIRSGQVLRDYQGVAVDLLGISKGLLLGDEVGLGKTFSACGAMLLPGALPATVVCHPHLAEQWRGVIGRFTNLSAICVKHAKPYELPAADVTIFRYTQLLGWVDLFETMRFPLCVFDEIQELRTGTDSAKGRAAGRLAKYATYRLGLTATPIYNYGDEIHTIMEYVRPGLLGSREEFLREWQPSGRIADPKALGAYLREQHAFLRRTKQDVGKEMPAVNRVVQPVDFDEKEIHSADDLAHALAVKATTGEFAERGHAVRELDLLVRHQTGIAKAKHVAQFVRIIADAGTPVLLVGWHRDVYDIWLDELKDFAPAMYTGSETAHQKGEAAQRFVTGETDVMIISLRSGAGLDGLQHRCSTVIFGELDWSPGVHHQVIGRLDREGQKDPVTAIFLVTSEGSDPPMMEVLGLKASEASAIVDPSLGVQSVHSDASPGQTLVQQYLRRRWRAVPEPAEIGPLFEMEMSAEVSA